MDCCGAARARYKHTRFAVRQYVDIARADDMSSRPFASRKRSAGTTFRGVLPMSRHSVSISRGKASPRTNVTKYRDLSRRSARPAAAMCGRCNDATHGANAARTCLCAPASAAPSSI